MGIFNFFIVIPEIIAGALFNRVVNFLSPRLPASIDVRLAVVMIGGCALLLAAVLMQRVEDIYETRSSTDQLPATERPLAAGTTP